MNPVLAKGKAILDAIRSNGAGQAETGTTLVAGDGKSRLAAVAGYMRNGISPYFANWMPALRDTGEDVRDAWEIATARATDTIQNSGWISGGIQSACGAVLGTGLRLTAQPDTTLINFAGLTDDDGAPIDAEGWARFVERRYEAWASDPRECDARGRQTIAEMERQQFKTWFATGEMLSTIPYRREEGVISNVKILCLPPHRLTQKTDTLARMYQGVKMDGYGRPYSYSFTFRDRFGIEQTQEILARDAAGRPQVTHIFEGDVTQVRGITPLVPALQVVKQFDQLSNATLLAALIQTIFAATVESEAPTAEVLQGLQNPDEQGLGGNLENFIAARMGWHSNTNIDLGESGKIAHLFPGEKLKFNRSEHPNTVYESFARFLLREIAKACGVTFEQLTGDYTGVTYTGVRMSGSEIWQTVLHRRKNLAGRWRQAGYEAWLEDEIESGRIKFPGGLDGFLRLRSAATRASWRGPPKPQADDLKTMKALEIGRAMGVISDEQICGEIGDMEVGDVYAARAREAGLRKKLGLEDTGPSTAKSIAQTQAEAMEDNADDDEPADRIAA